uniref:Uncharacterized protein n=1 Tax=Anopheles funestus TaxID=62324 RepID=A0A182S207_ANOFN
MFAISLSVGSYPWTGRCISMIISPSTNQGSILSTRIIATG